MYRSHHKRCASQQVNGEEVFCCMRKTTTAPTHALTAHKNPKITNNATTATVFIPLRFVVVVVVVTTAATSTSVALSALTYIHTHWCAALIAVGGGGIIFVLPHVFFLLVVLLLLLLMLMMRMAHIVDESSPYKCKCGTKRRYTPHHPHPPVWHSFVLLLLLFSYISLWCNNNSNCLAPSLWLVALVCYAAVIDFGLFSLYCVVHLTVTADTSASTPPSNGCVMFVYLFDCGCLKANP